MTIIVNITDRAKADLQDIASYIAADNPIRAKSYIAEVLSAAIKTISHFPYSCPIYNQHEIARTAHNAHHRSKVIRCYMYKKYKVLYWADSEQWAAYVLRVIHSAALLGALIDAD